MMCALMTGKRRSRQSAFLEANHQKSPVSQPPKSVPSRGNERAVYHDDPASSRCALRVAGPPSRTSVPSNRTTIVSAGASQAEPGPAPCGACVCKWAVSVLRCENDWGHCGQRNGFSPVWTRRWLLRLHLWAKVLPHRRHWKGRSPVCVRWCTMRLHLYAVVKSQLVQRNSRRGSRHGERETAGAADGFRRPRSGKQTTQSPSSKFREQPRRRKVVKTRATMCNETSVFSRDVSPVVEVLPRACTLPPSIKLWRTSS